ncbi:SAP30-binding protein [Malaya genurostris]|uniref:SAP30-binding protein n=1 Tax=Malaya genurostris TaxID=325434 RepID=UPI0026F38DD9|nr:SAP30-binding protein [Malaya genurostris]
MSGKNSALASLTATYTDSENEDDQESGNESLHSDGSSSSHGRVRSRQQTPLREQSERSDTPSEGATNATKSNAPPSAELSRSNESTMSRQKALRLVSYFDDTVVSDDENASPNRERDQTMDISDEDTPATDSKSPKKIDRSKLYGFSLPPESKGKCSVELQEKIATLYEKMRNSNMDTNKIIQERKEFRNPSIYEKLIQFCDINELGTNYSPDIFDPSQWGKDSYYEELAKAQKIEMEKVEKARKENAKTEIQTGVKKMDTDDSKKRKSKWDQPGVFGVAPGTVTTAGVLKAAAIITQTLTTTATGTKGTVISAFGSLPKKPKV